jgi:membrane protease YdiL (CAAX protease family)
MSDAVSGDEVLVSAEVHAPAPPRWKALFQPRYEPWVVLGGLYAFTALYYTRLLPLQLLSFAALLGVTAYWSHAIRQGTSLHWRDFKLHGNRLGLQLAFGLGLAIFGWFFFRTYIYLTRGEWLQVGYGGSPAAILSILAVASAEEIFFRGYFQNRLGPRYRTWVRVLLGVLSLAMYKNVVHMWNGMPLVLHLELLAVGILHNVLLSIWMEWTDSLVGPLVAHIVWDLLVYAPLAGIPYWVF